MKKPRGDCNELNNVNKKNLRIESMKSVKPPKLTSRQKKSDLSNAASPSGPALTTPEPPLQKPITVRARIDVGFGNSLFLRGEGTGLSWNRGLPLTCVDGSTWKWSGEASDPVKFKLLLNDHIWSAGEDIVAAPGQTVELSPGFS